MDYSYDQCMRKFSNGQVARIIEMTTLHRPGLVASSFGGFLDDGTSASTTTVAASTTVRWSFVEFYCAVVVLLFTFISESESD